MSGNSDAHDGSEDNLPSPDIRTPLPETGPVITSLTSAGDAASLLREASHTLSRRRDQRSIFPTVVFRESCWDIMLLCFLDRLEARQSCIKQIRNQLDESNTALLRRIDELEQAGLLQRHRDAVDGRRTMVRLTEQGIAAMTRFFSEANRTQA